MGFRAGWEVVPLMESGGGIVVRFQSPLPEKQPMKFKTVLYLLGGAFVLVLGLGVLWWRSNGPELLQKARTTMDEGHALGLRSDGTQCVDSTLSQMDPQTPTIGSMVRLGLFFRACADKSSGLRTICAQDTSSGRMGVRWLGELCLARGIKNPACPSVLSPLAELCTRKT